jgi:hypothetical protein
MKEPLDPSQLLMVYTTTETMMDRVDEDPPQVAVDTDDEEFRKQLLDSAKKGAYAYDVYRDLRQISFLTYSGPGAPKFQHFMFCDDPDVDIEEHKVNGEERSVHVFDTESSIAGAVGNYLSNHYMSCQGAAVKWRWLTGWKVGTDVWPFLINKLMKYNAWVPDLMKTDITRRWNSVNYLLDVSNIYSQGVSMGMRRLPTCSDALKYWGYDRPGGQHASAGEIRDQICTDPSRAVGLIEPYLEDMFDVVLRYEDVGEPWRQ